MMIPLMMNDFMQILIRDRQGGTSDLNSSASTINTEPFLLVSDNARVFAEAVPKSAISHLQTTSNNNNNNETENRNNANIRADRWGAISSLNNGPGNSNNDINSCIHNRRKDRWGTNSDLCMAMPQRKCASPYLTTSTRFLPPFDVSSMELPQEIFSPEKDNDDDDDDDDSLSSSSSTSSSSTA